MVVIAIGGSVLTTDEHTLDTSRIRKYVACISEYHEVVDGIVVGGGSIAREYIETGSELGVDEKTLDDLGIQTTRLNATLLANAIDTVEVQTSKNVQKGFEHVQNGVLPVIGGTRPGQTTDTVATEFASLVDESSVLFASNIDGVYDTRGGITLEDATMCTDISTAELRDICKDTDDEPGRNTPIDSTAIQLLDDFQLEARVFDGTDIQTVEAAIKGNSIGTRVYPK